MRPSAPSAPNPWISLSNPWIFSTIYALMGTPFRFGVGFARIRLVCDSVRASSRHHSKTVQERKPHMVIGGVVGQCRRVEIRVGVTAPIVGIIPTIGNCIPTISADREGCAAKKTRTFDEKPRRTPKNPQTFGAKNGEIAGFLPRWHPKTIRLRRPFVFPKDYTQIYPP